MTYHCYSMNIIERVRQLDFALRGVPPPKKRFYFFGKWLCPECKQPLRFEQSSAVTGLVILRVVFHQYWECKCGYEYGRVKVEEFD